LIEFDKTHFYQVITNMLQNAIEASPSEKTINLELKEKDNKIILAIVDYGIGIAENDLKRIFEPYFSTKKKGIGLGLALVKKLVELNNAEIEVNSQVGEGTTFKIIMECPHENIDY